MAKILFATMPITGHVNPGLPIAKQLIENGHEVAWYTGKKFKQAIEATGAQHMPMGSTVDFNDSRLDTYFPERRKYKGIEQLKFDMKHIFIDPIPESIREMKEILNVFPAKVTVVDTAFGSGPLLSQIGGPPCVAFGITAFPLASDEVAPFGLGLLPDESPVGKLRNRFLAELATKVIFKDVIEHRNTVRARFNLPPDFGGVFDGIVHGSTLYLQGTVAEFEYPRKNMPEHVRFIGPLLPEAPAELNLPDWWDEMLNCRKPVIHVAQGTIATDIDELIMPAIFALADMDVLVVVSSKGIPAASQAQLPANVRVAQFLPYSELMQHVDLFITNGGYGGVHYALAAGVPILASGSTEDKPEVSNRIEWSGAGINLRTNRPDSFLIRQAVKKILRNSSFKRNAQRLSASIKTHNARQEAARLIESIALA